jgi:MFS family permease
VRFGGRTFASVRKHRNYRLYFGGQAVSFTGTWVQQIAASWLVLQLTHSPVAVGALALAQLLPVTVLGLFVGTLIDRFDVRRLALCTEGAQLAIAATLAALTLGGWIEVWQIYVLAVLQGIGQSVGGPSRHALVFQMVGREDLANAIALNSSLGTTARVVGPAVGGAIVALAGPGVAFAINSGSFLAELLALLAIDVSKLHHPIRDHGATMVGGALDALRFVLHNARAGVAFFGVLVLSTFCFNLNVLFPLLADRTLHSGAQTFGLIASCFGAGALIGALAAARRGQNSMRYLLVGAFVYGVLELVLAPQTSVVVVCAILFVTGVFYIQWGTTALTAIQLEAPDHLRGRAASLYFWAFLGGAPLGGVFAGWLVSLGGTELAFYVAGTIAVLTSLVGTARLSSASGGSPIPRPGPSGSSRRPFSRRNATP